MSIDKVDIERRCLDHALPTLLTAAKSPIEMCGFVYGDEVIAIANVHPEPETNFAMAPVAQFETMDERGWPTAVWHTHPDNNRNASKTDLGAALPGVFMVISTPDGWAGAWLDGVKVGEATKTDGWAWQEPTA